MIESMTGIPGLHADFHAGGLSLIHEMCKRLHVMNVGLR